MAEAKKSTARKPAARKSADTDEVTGKKLSDAHGTGAAPDAESTAGFPEGEGPVKEDGVEKFTTVSEDTAAPSPPGWKFGEAWNSDDARKAYEAEGTTLEAESMKGAEGEPRGTALPPGSERK
jgi:hypothetical protein